MRSKCMLGTIVVALAVSGCSGSSPDEDPGRSRDPARSTITSSDRSLTARLPAGWSRVRDSYPLALLTIASGPISGRIIGPCQPGSILDELPKGGALVRISENYPPVVPAGDAVGRLSRPGHLRLDRARPYECGPSFVPVFNEGQRQFAASIWTRPVRTTMEINGRKVNGRRRGPLAPTTRRKLLRLLNHLIVRPAATEPIRRPMLALDCRNPPNVLGCDRVWVDLTTRIRMKHVSVRIRRWSIKTHAGWVNSEPVKSRPTRLRTLPAGDERPPAMASHTYWTGTVRHAGLRGGGTAFEEVVPGPAEYWTGSNPPIRADIEVIGARGRWQFRGIQLIAGHG